MLLGTSAGVYMLIGVIIVVLLAALWLVPRWQVTLYPTVPEKDRADLENEFRKTIGQIITGIAVVFSLFFTWAQMRQARVGIEQNTNLAQEQLAIARRERIARQMASALGQFGDTTHSEIRLAGIFSLEQIAAQSDTDRMPLVRMLATYVRDRRQIGGVRQRRLPPFCADTVPLDADIQGALDAVRRVSWRISEPGQRYNRIVLRYADLRNAQLDTANLQFAALNGSILSRASFLEGATLYRADLTGANLEGASIGSARRARFDRAKLCGAHLEGAALDSSTFQSVDFTGANLSGATLRGASFDGADLSEAEGLEQEQIDAAFLSSTTKLPAALHAPPRVPRGDTMKATCACKW
jgi:Pentapeptide repeats (8 copies)